MNFKFFMEVLFPRRCLRCRNTLTNGVVCDQCLVAVTIHDSLFCGKCKARLPSARKICHNDFPYILGAAGSYGDKTIQTLIHHLKFRGIRDAAEPLAEIIVRYLSKLERDLTHYYIVPIPLSQKRRRERGFNQSERIGAIVAKQLAIPIETTCLIRARHTAAQSTTKSASERRKNVNNCFAVINNSLHGKNIILVDDVTTSGATLLEAARTLKQAGVQKIIAVTAAMT